MDQNQAKHLPEVAVEYIEDVVRRMRYRRARRDVRAELEAHFEDALAGYPADEERRDAARQLIEAFGEPETLAVLIRRAKKRCRPLWQKILIRSGQALGLLFVYGLLCTARLYWGHPVIRMDTVERLNQVTSQGRSEDLNAEPILERAVETLPVWQYLDKELWQMNDTEKEVLDAYLQSCEPAFQLLRQAVERPYYWVRYRPMDGEDTGIVNIHLLVHLQKDLSPRLAKYRHLTQAMGYQIQWDCKQGRGDRALEDCLVLMQLGRHLAGRGLLVEQLVGIAIMGAGQNRMTQVLAAAPVSAETVESVLRDVRDLCSDGRPWLSYDCEKVFAYDLIQRGFTDDGQGNGRVLAQGLFLVAEDIMPLDWGADLLLFDFPDRREFTGRVDRYFTDLEETFKTASPLDPQPTSQDLTGGGIGFLLGLLRPAFEDVLKLGWRLRTGRRATLAILAIEVYERTEGHLPETLADLVAAGLLDAVPRDNYSGGALVYRRTDKGFLLYSVGEDLKDDNGTPATGDNGRLRDYGPHGDWVFWPVRP